jgi:hypothetical protein
MCTQMMGCKVRPGQTGSLISSMGRATALYAGPTPCPTSCLELNQSLEATSYLKVMVSKSTNVTFWEQQNECCYSL